MATPEREQAKEKEEVVVTSDPKTLLKKFRGVDDQLQRGEKNRKTQSSVCSRRLVVRIEFEVVLSVLILWRAAW